MQLVPVRIWQIKHSTSPSLFETRFKALALRCYI